MPPGFAHGFCVTSDVAQVEYKCTALYDPDSEIGIAWNDPSLAIPWPVERPILSERDSRHPRLSGVLDRLPVWTGSPGPADTFVRTTTKSSGCAAPAGAEPPTFRAIRTGMALAMTGGSRRSDYGRAP